MKARIGIAIVLALVLALLFASVAMATSQATIDKIIKDAQDNGTLDGTYSAADVQAALDYVKANPTIEQYSNVQGVLSDYLASLQSPGASNAGQELSFTGGELVMVFAAGAGLIGSGTLLRRRRR
jgi:hypothetical protein